MPQAAGRSKQRQGVFERRKRFETRSKAGVHSIALE
jgi:hypothetical protein